MVRVDAPPLAARLPTGTVTFLFTDVEGSTRLWERHPSQMRGALATHDAIVELLTETHGGQVVRPRGEGDSRFCVFPRASDAVHAAAAIQRALLDEPWPPETPLRVRMALHTGEADLREGDYYGTAVNRAARLRAIAHGGQTLVSGATSTLALPLLANGVVLLDLGTRRLRDLGEPEHVFQLAAPGLPRDFPPLLSLDALPNNLPLQVTTFIGREREAAEVKRLLAGARLLTLTGTGGSGKTRLALQAAADVIEGYPDGVWFVDLAPLADPHLVATTALSVLGLPEPAGQPALSALITYLKARRSLLVLDNCEHVIESCARLADAVIHQCPDVRILATSREMLGVPGETAWRVPSLSLPEPDAAAAYTAERLEQFEAVRLFIERAVAVQPSFRVTNDNAPAVAQVCYRLDGIPLAIELAAARVRVLSAEQIAARLNDRFRLLTGGGRTALRRQQTLQALVDWSHDLLGDSERALFRRLAVFAGGFTLEAAEAVCAGEPVEPFEVLDLLTGLVDKSLVVADTTGAAQRYRLLETMRQYAEDKLLQAGEAAALRDRHLEWCLSLTREIRDAEMASDVARMRPSRDRYHAEGDNVRAALTWGLGTPEGAKAGLELLANAGYVPRASLPEGSRWLETLLAAAPDRTSVRARALLWLDHFRRWYHDVAGAQAAVDEARAIAQEVGDEHTLVQASSHDGLVAAVRGDYAYAIAQVERALAAARALGRSVWVERFTRDLGVISIAMGDFARARDALRETRELALRMKSPQAARSLLLLTIVDRLTGDPAAAREKIETLDDSTIGQGPYAGIGPVLWARANLARDEGRLDEARVAFVRSLRGLQQRSEIQLLESPLCMLAMAEVASGAPDRVALGVTLLAACAPEHGPIGTVHIPEVRVEAPHFLERARAALGEDAYASAWQRGKRLSVAEAVELALSAHQEKPPS